MKKISAVLLTFCLLFTVCACGGGESEAIGEENKEETVSSVTLGELAADGLEHTVCFSIYNRTGSNLVGFYMKDAADEDEAENVLPEDFVLPSGDSFNGFEMIVSRDSFLTCDVGILLEGANEPIWFFGCDLSGKKADEIGFTFSENGNGSWSVVF